MTVALATFEPEPEATALDASIDEYLGLGDWVVESDEDLQIAADAINDIKNANKRYDAIEKSATEGLVRSLAVIRGWFRPRRVKGEQARQLFDEKVRAYATTKALRVANAEVALTAAVAAQDASAASAALAVLAPAEKTEGLGLEENWEYEEFNHSIVPSGLTVLAGAAVVKAEIKRQRKEGIAQPAIPGLRIFRRDIVKATKR